MTGHSEATLVVAAVIADKSASKRRFLVVRRGPSQSGAGYWEFPGGKVEPGEDSQIALMREIEEELAMQIQVGDLLGEQEFAYPSRVIRLRVYLCTTDSAEMTLTEHDAHKWQDPWEMDAEELSPADRPFVELLRQRYGRR